MRFSGSALSHLKASNLYLPVIFVKQMHWNLEVFITKNIFIDSIDIFPYSEFENYKELLNNAIVNSRISKNQMENISISFKTVNKLNYVNLPQDLLKHLQGIKGKILIKGMDSHLRVKICDINSAQSF